VPQDVSLTGDASSSVRGVTKAMSDTVQTPRATALEVPVTIQGSQILPGTDRRELFTETTKTTLTLEKGAVVNLKARVLKGQSLFLRNELSGREILCRVLEAPPEGQSGYTDLEFTVHDPEFWSVYERQSKAPDEAGTADGAAATATAAPDAEAGAHVERQIPGFSETTTPPSAAAPIEASHESAEQAPAAHVDDAREAEQLAGIVASAVKRMAKRAAEKEANAAEQDAAAGNNPAQGETIPEPTRKQKAFSTLAFRLHAIRELTVRKNPVVLGVVAAVVIGAALGVAWDVQRMLYPPLPKYTVIVAKKVAPQPRPATAAPAQTKSTSAPSAPRIQPPTVAQVPAARIAKTPAATTVSLRPERESKPLAAPIAVGADSNLSAADAEHTAPGPAKHHRGDLSVEEMIPAKIVAQNQPPLPQWAKDVDLDGTVKLDVVVDANGNLVTTKLLSGPRALESAAEGAVGLWIFAPAIRDGKPIATHMVLTVEFQR
jgi:periplasmic protein TonB